MLAVTRSDAEPKGIDMTPKLKTKRCLPLIARTEDCAICMKVCPIRRYGVGAVTDSGDELKTR